MRTLVVMASTLWVLTAQAQPSGIRGACKIFIERSVHGTPTPDFGDFSDWTVIDNKDGTYSVGGKYTLANGNRAAYTTCIIRPSQKGFDLVKLARLI